MAKEKGFIVLEVGYDYNDEVYHTGNYGETYEAPSKVFLNKEKAELEAKKLSVEMVRKITLGSYAYSVKDITKKGRGDVLDALCEELGFSIDDGEDLPKKATDEQIEKLLDCLTLQFYKVVEVEIE